MIASTKTQHSLLRRLPELLHSLLLRINRPGRIVYQATRAGEANPVLMPGGRKGRLGENVQRAKLKVKPGYRCTKGVILEEIRLGEGPR